jgi:hypothetical protein
MLNFPHLFIGFHCASRVQIIANVNVYVSARKTPSLRVFNVLLNPHSRWQIDTLPHPLFATL